MKTLTVFILALMGLTFLRGQGLCGYDSLGGGSSGVSDLDTAVIGQYHPRCTNCDVQQCVAWTLAENFNGHIALYSPDSVEYSIQLTRDCHLLRWDSCRVLGQRHPSVPRFYIGFGVTSNVQIVVCGAIGDTVLIESKISPQPLRRLDSTLVDLNTCAVPVGLTDPAAGKTNWLYRRFDTMEMVTPPLAPGIYFEYDPTFYRHGRIIKCE